MLDIALLLAALQVLAGSPTLRFFPEKISADYGESDLHGSAVVMPNLYVKNFGASPEEPFNDFETGRSLNFTCEIAGDRLVSGTKFSAVIKSGTEEITREVLTVVTEDSTWEISGKFSPSQSGINPFACRVDTEYKIEEKDERDNREVLFLLITGDY